MLFVGDEELGVGAGRARRSEGRGDQGPTEDGAVRLAFVFLVACAAPKPEPLETPTPRTRPHETVTLAAPSPPIDLQNYEPDVSDYGRWPLTVAQHPELEPHFAIANALAEPGLGWIDLCARGAQQRVMARDADYGDYLAAWCSVGKDDATDALARLGNLHRSLRLRAAIDLDAAAIVVASFDFKVVEGVLRRANLLELAIVDRIAAAYFEIGNLEGASELNRLAQQMDREPSAEVACARRLRAVADGGEQATLVLGVLGRLPAPKIPTPCETRAQELACWTGKTCTAASYSAVKRDGITNLSRAMALWPRGEVGFDRWEDIGDAAFRGWPLDEAYALAVPALELALRTSRCDVANLRRVGQLASILETAPKMDSEAATMWEVDRGPLPPALEHRYGDRIRAVAVRLQHLPIDDKASCKAELAALPPVRVP